MYRLIALAALIVLGPFGALAQTPETGSAPLSPAVERVLRYVPEDTHLLIVIPNLDELIGGVSRFGAAAAIDDLAELTAGDVLEDPLGDQVEGVDTTGPFVLAVSADRDAPLIYVTLRSAEPWSEAPEPTALGDARVYEFESERYVAVTKDNVAVFARDVSDLRYAVRASGAFVQRLGPRTRVMLAGRQLVFWADVQAWLPTIQQTMSFVAQTAYMGLASAGPDADMVIQMYKLGFEQFEKLLSEAETYTAAVRVDRQGVFLEDQATFAADGAVGRYLKSVRRPQRDLLRGLPVGGVAAFACEWELPEGAETLNEMLARFVFASPAVREELGPEGLEDIRRKTTQAYRNMSGVCGAVRSNESGKGLMIYGLYLTDDAETLRKDLCAVYQQKPQLLASWGSVSPMGLRHETERIGEIEVDAYVFDFGAEQEQMQPMMQAIYGKDSTLYVTRHQEGCAFVLGERTAARELTARMASGDVRSLSREQRVEALFARLSPHPQACVLVDLPEFFQTIGMMVQEMGMPFPTIDFGATRFPLAGLTFYIEPQALRMELYVPSKPIRALVEEMEEVQGSER